MSALVRRLRAVMMSCALSASSVVFSAAVAGAGVPGEFGGGDAVVEQKLDKDAPYRAACKQANSLAANKNDLIGCYGESSRAGWDAVITAGERYKKVGCTDTVDPAVTMARSELLEAEKGLPSAQRALSDATIEFTNWKASKEPGATQKAIDAEKAQRDAGAALLEAQARLEKAKLALAAVILKSTADAVQAKQGGLQAFQAAISNAEGTTRSERDFEALLRDEGRRAICLRLQSALMSALSATSAPKENEAARAAENDRRIDTLRKAQGTASATTTASSLIENPGSLDRFAYSVLTGLGADAKTTGTQAVLNLNLSSLIWQTDADRLKQPVWQRNLFIRGAFPLSATDEVPQTGEGSAGAGSPDEVSRFSLLLGGSFVDETDTRLPTNQDCYKLVVAYVPFPQTVEEAAPRSEERKRYYDVCARISANKTRLAWRAGMGFYTPNDKDTPKTRPELAVGAIVWGPTSWLYLNFLYQAILKPERIDNAGVGFSFAGNADGRRSGVDATLRVGLDFLFLVNYAHADESTDWEMRIAPTVRGKLFANSIGMLAVGPRFLGSKLDSPSLMATLALTYDADVLVDSLLTPPAPNAVPVAPN